MSAAAPGLERFAISARRRRIDKLARVSLLAGTLIAVVPLILIVYYLLSKGLGSWSVSFFTTDPTGQTFFHNESIGGIKSALLGTLEIILIATVMAVPIGIGVALWLVEFGRNTPFARVVRFFVDVLTGVPSIVFGLFIYIVLVVGHTFAGYDGALAVALLMLPIVVRSAEVVLVLVPNSLREAALALGAPRWRMVFSIVLRTAFPGLVTGMLLAIARGAGETAPLLFTAGATNVSTLNPSNFMNSLPVQIFSDINSPTNAVIARAWGTALALVTLVLLFNLFARLVARRSRPS